MKKYIPIFILLVAVSLLGLSCKKNTTPAKVQTPPKQEQAKPEAVNTTLDSDKDGLIDTEEAKLGTNPNNPDTDGDGYNDGTEVAGGYDPLIAGGTKKETTLKTDTNSNNCSELETTYDKDYCYLQQLTQTKDPKICTLVSETKRDECYLVVGGLIFQIPLCNNINDESLKVQCYLAVGKGTGNYDIKLCNTIKGIEVKNNCLERMGDYTQNPTILADRYILNYITALKSGIEVYNMTTGHYPIVTKSQVIDGLCFSSNGFESVCSGATIYEKKIESIPASTKNCSPGMTYSSIDNGADYQLKFCLGGVTDSYAAGTHIANSAGIQ